MAPMGPVAIFDKSALQALSMDEAVFFDAFFIANVVPLFYVETLADLEKDVGDGKDPEDLVGMLATKTPSAAYPNVFHRQLVLGELAGHEIAMRGQVMIGEGQRKQAPDGAIGLHIEEFPEAVALQRWQTHEFLEVERETAKHWRAELEAQDPQRTISQLKHTVPADRKIPSLAELKAFADDFCSSPDAAEVLRLVLEVLEVPENYRQEAIRRWEVLGKPTLNKFAPYTAHVFKVDMVFYLGVDRDLISGERASNKVDMAYLYYLPFAKVFVSKDKLHHRTAPLFLTAEQSYLTADELKEALAEFDKHYSTMPEEITALGVLHFASWPPAGMDNAVTRLWDKYMRADWREAAKASESRLGTVPDEETSHQTISEVEGRLEQAQPIPNEAVLLGDEAADYTVIQRRVPATKGKWRMVSKEVEEAGDETGAS